MPGSDHIGGDTRRPHPGYIRVPQLAERDCLEPCRLSLGGELAGVFANRQPSAVDPRKQQVIVGERSAHLFVEAVTKAEEVRALP
jgi:hypothetical protein